MVLVLGPFFEAGRYQPAALSCCQFKAGPKRLRPNLTRCCPSWTPGGFLHHALFKPLWFAIWNTDILNNKLKATCMYIMINCKVVITWTWCLIFCISFVITIQGLSKVIQLLQGNKHNHSSVHSFNLRAELIVECNNCTYTPRELSYLGENIMLTGIDRYRLEVSTNSTSLCIILERISC